MSLKLLVFMLLISAELAVNDTAQFVADEPKVVNLTQDPGNGGLIPESSEPNVNASIPLDIIVEEIVEDDPLKLEGKVEPSLEMDPDSGDIIRQNPEGTTVSEPKDTTPHSDDLTTSKPNSPSGNSGLETLWIIVGVLGVVIVVLCVIWFIVMSVSKKQRLGQPETTAVVTAIPVEPVVIVDASPTPIVTSTPMAAPPLVKPQ